MSKFNAKSVGQFVYTQTCVKFCDSVEIKSTQHLCHCETRKKRKKKLFGAIIRKKCVYFLKIKKKTENLERFAMLWNWALLFVNLCCVSVWVQFRWTVNTVALIQKESRNAAYGTVSHNASFNSVSSAIMTNYHITLCPMRYYSIIAIWECGHCTNIRQSSLSVHFLPF